MKKSISFFIIFLWFVFNGFSQVISVEENLTTNTTRVDNPVKIAGIVTVSDGVTLANTSGTKDPGDTIQVFICEGDSIFLQGEFQTTEGVYVDTLEDGLGEDSIVFTELYLYSVPHLTINSENVSCNGYSDGSINLTVTSGSGPYTYLWSNGAVTQDISGVFPGTYLVEVLDANGCVSEASVYISQPAPLNVTSYIVPASCNGPCTGEITIFVSGGTTPYIYCWPFFSSSPHVENLCAGDYYLTVIDINGCNYNGDNHYSVTVTESDLAPPDLTNITICQNSFNNDTCDFRGTVIDHTGLDGCHFLIMLDNGLELQPINMSDFTVYDGQRVTCSYTDTSFLSTCMHGHACKLTCLIYENSIPGSVYAVGTNISWYSDHFLENLVDTGNIFFPPDSVPGIYHYFATDSVGSCVSDYSGVVVTVDPSFHQETSQLICPGDSVFFFGNYYYETGLYFEDYISEDWCDSIYSLDLTVLSDPFADNNDTLCIDGWLVLDAQNPGATYLWSTGDTGQSVTIYGNELLVGWNSFWVTVSNDSCVIADTIEVWVDYCDNIEKIVVPGLNIYPNPASNQITVSAAQADEIVLIDSKGIPVKSIKNPKHPEIIDISELQPGLYLVLIRNSAGMVTGRVVKL